MRRPVVLKFGWLCWTTCRFALPASFLFPSRMRRAFAVARWSSHVAGAGLVATAVPLQAVGPSPTAPCPFRERRSAQWSVCSQHGRPPRSGEGRRSAVGGAPPSPLARAPPPPSTNGARCMAPTGRPTPLWSTQVRGTPCGCIHVQPPPTSGQGTRRRAAPMCRGRPLAMM